MTSVNGPRVDLIPYNSVSFAQLLPNSCDEGIVDMYMQESACTSYPLQLQVVGFEEDTEIYIFLFQLPHPPMKIVVMHLTLLN